MRSMLLPLGLFAALPLCSQDGAGRWFLDVHSLNGTMEGHYQGLQDGNPFLVDLKSDLALKRDKGKPGFGLEYQGHRFGLEVSRDEQEFAGANIVDRAITIDGQTFNVGAKVTSRVKVTTTSFNWTIRALAWEQFWLGIDLGVRGIALDLNASGVEGFSGYSASVRYKDAYPVPMVGVAAGFQVFDGRLVGRAFYHSPRYSGASYTHTGADLRFFPISWLGVRAFTSTEQLRVPKGSINKEIDIALDQTGSGFGVVLRF